MSGREDARSVMQYRALYGFYKEIPGLKGNMSTTPCTRFPCLQNSLGLCSPESSSSGSGEVGSWRCLVRALKSRARAPPAAERTAAVERGGRWGGGKYR